MASPTVVSVDDPLAGHPLAACGADEAKQKENQNDFRTNCAWRGHLNGGTEIGHWSVQKARM